MNVDYIESEAIPFEHVINAFRVMEYASVTSVMFKTLTFTGCRTTELNNMKMSNFFNKDGKIWIYWKLGKNQNGTRAEPIPQRLYKEILEYRKKNNVPGDKIFHIKHKTFKRYFNVKTRPKLNKAWNKKYQDVSRDDNMIKNIYRLHFKGLRKNFASLKFWKNYKKYDSRISLEKTCKKMSHSSDKITAHYYAMNFERLNLEKWGNKTLPEILYNQGQKQLTAFQDHRKPQSPLAKSEV